MSCSQTTTPCTNCEDVTTIVSTFCDTGCTEIISSECVTYAGEDIDTSSINIHKGDKLTDVIKELANTAFDIDIGITFNSTTRQLCLQKMGTTIQCVTIPDLDDQYLALDGTKIQIFNSADVKINEIDIASLITAEVYDVEVNTTSLVVSQTGTHGEHIVVDMSYSGDIGNQLRPGSDGKAYVGPSAQAISNVVVVNTECVTWAKTYASGTVTLTPTFDWACVAEIVCPLCLATCSSPSNLNVEIG